jgi:hypothetical protein
MSTDEIFRHTFYNANHLPKGVFLLDDSSVFYGWPCNPIVRCIGRWPDHDRASGEVCDPDSWKYYYDRASGDVEFYVDSLNPSDPILCCRETDVFLRDLVTSTPALEKEIRRRDDIEGIPGRARIKAVEAQYEAMRPERERLAAAFSAKLAQEKMEREARKAAIVERKNRFYDEMKRAGMLPDPELEALLKNLTSFTGTAP